MHWETESAHLIALVHEIVDLGHRMKTFNRRARQLYFTGRFPLIALAALGIPVDFHDRTEKDLDWNLEHLAEDSAADYTGPYASLFDLDPATGSTTICQLAEAFARGGGAGCEAHADPGNPAGVCRVEHRHVKALIREIIVMGQRMARVDRFDPDAFGCYFSTSLPDIALDILGYPEDYTEPTAFEFNADTRVGPGPADYRRDYDMFNYASFLGEELLERVLGRIRSNREEYGRIKAAQKKIGAEQMKRDRDRMNSMFLRLLNWKQPED
jgi:hypothetical protein